ncbi:MAG: hypothetical protein KatS3mg111_3614 [Pirellulaceae bacterium]|nr:MAG: hypothetical protein KatS3mg111_3614 [Pirellulaceae bacterium]
MKQQIGPTLDRSSRSSRHLVCSLQCLLSQCDAVPATLVQLEITNTTYAAANRLVHRLAELGILTEITGYRRNRRFSYQPYIQLFRDDVEEPQ